MTPSMPLRRDIRARAGIWQIRPNSARHLSTVLNSLTKVTTSFDVADSPFFAYEQVMGKAPKPNKVTLNLTDDDYAAFNAGMVADKQKDLSPWIVSAVLLYLRDKTDHEYYTEETFNTVKSLEAKLDQHLARHK